MHTKPQKPCVSGVFLFVLAIKSGKMFQVNILPGVQSTYHKNGAFGLYLE